MPNSAMLNVSCASASDSPSAAFTAGITGMNRCTASGPISEIEASAIANNGPGVAVICAALSLRLQKFLYGAISLVYRRVGIGGGSGIGVGDGDAAEPRPPDHMRLLRFRPFRVEQLVIFVSVTVRPAIDGDVRHTPRRIEPAGAEDARQLVADVALEGFERGVEDIVLPCPVLLALRQPGLARRAHHADQHRLVRRTRAFVVADIDDRIEREH